MSPAACCMLHVACPTPQISALQFQLSIFPFHFPLQIRYDSFSAPLLLLGCFSKDSTSFPEATPTFLHPSHSSSDSTTNNEKGSDVTDGGVAGDQRGNSAATNPSPAFQTSGSFSNFEAEFKTWKQPSEHLNENSFVFCAAEIFRFLRDMALDVPGTGSASILTTGGGKAGGSLGRKAVGGGGVDNIHQREKNFYGAPPVTTKKFGGNSQHLIHPGAILCMMDLLPSVVVSEEMFHPQPRPESASGRGISPLLGERSVSPLSDTGLGSSSKPNMLSATTGGVAMLSTSPSQKSEDSFFDATGEVGVALRGEESGEEVELMKPDEMRQVCIAIQYIMHPVFLYVHLVCVMLSSLLVLFAVVVYVPSREGGVRDLFTLCV